MGFASKGYPFKNIFDFTTAGDWDCVGFASKGYPFKNTFDFTTAGDWDYVAVVESLPALHYCVDFIFLSFGVMGFIVEL